MNKTKNNFKIKSILTSVFILIIIVLFNLITQSTFLRLDLTSEKRYTLSGVTKEELQELPDRIFIRVYLDGELNIPFQQFRKSIKELLDECKVYGGNNFDYQFVDPFEDTDAQTRNKVLQELYAKGLQPTNIQQRDKKGNVSEQYVIPGAMVSYKGVEIPLNLLLNDRANSGEENLNNSAENLEYAFISTIHNLINENIQKIAFIEGHGEWPETFVKDISQELSKSYQIDRGRINGKPGVIDDYKAIVIAGPSAKFSEADKFVIDQYIMNGGKVVWLIDAVNVDFDSLATGYTLALPNELNLEDMLFRYGTRINSDLVLDAQCSFLPINVSISGNVPDFQPFPWIYYPLISFSDEDNITQNISMVQLRFASSIDTVSAGGGIKKTPLMVTSEYSMIKKVPAVIYLDEVNNPPSEDDFDTPHKTVGILLEGEFESVFKNRMVDEYFEDTPPPTVQKSKPTKMVVVSDADIIRNDVQNTAGGLSISALGYDRYTQQTYGNKEFLVNVINYLTDDADLLSLRGRNYQIRMLDRQKLSDEQTKWQIINIILPVLLIILMGFVYNYYRRFKYTH